jgi:hypothetical protein
VLVVRDVSTGKLLRRVWTTRSASPPMWSPDGKTVTIGG